MTRYLDHGFGIVALNSDNRHLLESFQFSAQDRRGSRIHFITRNRQEAGLVQSIGREDATAVAIKRHCEIPLRGPAPVRLERIQLLPEAEGYDVGGGVLRWLVWRALDRAERTAVVLHDDALPEDAFEVRAELQFTKLDVPTVGTIWLLRDHDRPERARARGLALGPRIPCEACGRKVRVNPRTGHYYSHNRGDRAVVEVCDLSDTLALPPWQAEDEAPPTPPPLTSTERGWSDTAYTGHESASVHTLGRGRIPEWRKLD